jgi:hypothetical protein
MLGLRQRDLNCRGQPGGSVADLQSTHTGEQDLRTVTKLAQRGFLVSDNDR